MQVSTDHLFDPETDVYLPNWGNDGLDSYHPWIRFQVRRMFSGQIVAGHFFEVIATKHPACNQLDSTRYFIIGAIPSMRAGHSDQMEIIQLLGTSSGTIKINDESANIDKFVGVDPDTVSKWLLGPTYTVSRRDKNRLLNQLKDAIASKLSPRDPGLDWR